MKPDPLLWNRNMVAEALSITPQQVSTLHRLGRLRGILLTARCLRWRPADVVAFVAGLSDVRANR
jgi:hypothetical protein